jgi:hypothetical protein
VQENDILAITFAPECPAFMEVWRHFAKLQEKLGGSALAGRHLFTLLREGGFTDVTLSVAPEVHWSGSRHFQDWLLNLIENVEGARALLLSHQLASGRQIDAAIAELRIFMSRPDASTFFYWNRAIARK